MLRNTQKYSHMVVAPQRVFDQKVVSSFRKFLMDFTDEGAMSKDPLELARTGKELLNKKLVELKSLSTGARYPFINQLDEPITMLTQLCDHTAEWYISDFNGADDLLDAKDNVIDPIKAFLNGTQRTIYDTAEEFMKTQQVNLGYLPANVAGEVSLLLEDPQVFRGNKISRLNSAVKALESRIQTAIEEQRVEAIDDINTRWQHIPASKAVPQATVVVPPSVTQKASPALGRVRQVTQIPVIRSLATAFADTTYPEILVELGAGACAPEPVVNQDPAILAPPGLVAAEHT